MSNFSLLSPYDKEYLVEIAQRLISEADFCHIYEDIEWTEDSTEAQEQAYAYLTTMLKVVQVDK